MYKRFSVGFAAAASALVLSIATPGAQPPVASASPSHGAFVYDGANYTGANTFIDADWPDLTSWFGNRISSLKVYGGGSIAVYSGVNYTGTCDTFVGQDPWLGDNRISNDTIASIKLNANCLGQVDAPVEANDLTVITGSSSSIQRPTGYVKSNQDLNEGANGAYIYACIRYFHPALVAHSTGLKLLTFFDSPGDIVSDPLTIIGATTDYLNRSNECAPGQLIDVDLNQGAGGAYEYFCVNRSSNGGLGFQDIQFLSKDASYHPNSDQLQQDCTSLFPDSPPASDISNRQPVDLNLGAHGRTIMLCTLVNSGHQQASPGALGITFNGTNRPTTPDGWIGGPLPVTLTWRCAPQQPWLPTQTITRTLTAEGAHQVLDVTCDGMWDGFTHAHDTQVVNIDTTPPTITYAGWTGPNANGWAKSNVTLNWTCTDALSGAVQPSITQVVSTEGQNQQATATCVDRVGNTASNTHASIFIDHTPPTLSVASRTPANASGWNNTDVVVDWQCADALSGTNSLHPWRNVTTEGAGQSATATCDDIAGNQTTSTMNGINIDKTAPGMTLQGRTPANAAGWNNAQVVATWDCADTGSGSIGDGVAAGLSAEGVNQSLSGTCVDRAGNTTTSTLSGINIDLTNPTTSAKQSVSKEGVSFTLSAKDRVSGVASTEYQLDDNAWTAYTGTAVLVSTPGAHTLHYRSTDRAGNQDTATLPVKVDTAP